MKTRRASRKNTTRRAKPREYDTHDNGGRPFHVIVAKHTITVTSNGKQVLHIPRYESVMVGANKGKYANPHEPASTGSSLLVHVGNKDYIYIGDRISKFKTKDIIREFHGIMGNSDVVYAFAIGSENTYFFISNKYLPNAAIDFAVDPHVSYFPQESKAKSMGAKILVPRQL